MSYQVIDEEKIGLVIQADESIYVKRTEGENKEIFVKLKDEQIFSAIKRLKKEHPYWSLVTWVASISFWIHIYIGCILLFSFGQLIAFTIAWNTGSDIFWAESSGTHFDVYTSMISLFFVTLISFFLKKL